MKSDRGVETLDSSTARPCPPAGDKVSPRSDRLYNRTDTAVLSTNLMLNRRTTAMTSTLSAAVFVLATTYLAPVEAQPASPVSASHQEFSRQLIAAAIDRTHHSVRYDPAYVRIPYPGGDVPADTGVCTDEVIRSYRTVGVDLQKEVHEDMVQNSSAYPRRWPSLAHPDTNIDHRRVPNLMVFFQRHGQTLPITSVANDYRPGDLVTWDLGGGVPHIGIVVDQKGTSGRYLIVHNIGQGPRMEDVLFHWKVTGHYRYYGPSK
jgi:uncharacterized protein YijF (DUF1287 family)